MLIRFAAKSLHARQVTVGLTVISLSVSILVLLAIHHIKGQAKSSFTKTVSGVDIIVGARTGQLNLLLYSVFRIGNATNNISWHSFEKLSQQKEVAWVIPLSLGDSHKGFSVLGTTENYFQHFRYSDKRVLEFNAGKPFSATFEAVIGSDVARKLKYKVGDSIILSHGTHAVSFSEHEDNPFTIVGILQATGTPVDRTVHVRLDGIEAIHSNWHAGVELPNGAAVSPGTPKYITAFMVGLKSKFAIFSFQRKVNQFEEEPLLAILPGVALTELWVMSAMLEKILLGISWLVLVAALIGLSTTMLASMRERKQEFMVLRAIGARPIFIFGLIQLEAIATVLISLVAASLTLSAAFTFLQNMLASRWGINISPWIFTAETLVPAGYILAATIIVGFVPAIAAYRRSC